jgi:hypothetical protein
MVTKEENEREKQHFVMLLGINAWCNIYEMSDLTVTTLVHGPSDHMCASPILSFS